MNLILNIFSLVICPNICIAFCHLPGVYCLCAGFCSIALDCTPVFDIVLNLCSPEFAVKSVFLYTILTYKGINIR